jgi:hypothetical protein
VLIPRYIYILELKRYYTVAIRLSYTIIYTSFIYYCLFLCNNNTILIFELLYPRAPSALSPEWSISGDQIYAYLVVYLITPPLGGVNFEVLVALTSYARIKL